MLIPIFALAFKEEGMSSPITTQILDFNDENDINFFAEDFHASDIITTTTTNTTTTTASCDNEGLFGYIDDDESFDFDPATISSLLDNDQPTIYEQQDVTYQLPVSVIAPDPETETRPGWRTWPNYNSTVFPIIEEQPIQMMGPPVGFAGINMLPTCTFLDDGIPNGCQPIMNGGEGQMGFFHARLMMSGEGAMGVQDGGFGGVYGPEAGQRVYNPIDMQVMKFADMGLDT